MSDKTAERRVTAADIAREVGVSRATVGFVLNSTPGQTISEVTQEKVLAAARRLGYRPHLAAQALASGRNRIILLVLPDWPIDYSMRRHVDEASTALDQAGYSLVTMTPHAGGKARPLWETLQPDVVMGMLPFDQEQFDEIRASGVAAVIPQPTEPTESDEQPFSFSQGPRLQVEHLVERDRRRLAYAASADPRLAELVTSRYELALATARQQGIADVAHSPVDAENVREVVAGWHQSGVTGIVAYNDDVAALVVGAALREGIAVPGDIAVIGHDDAPISSVFVPSISTVHIDDEGLGRYFADLALAAAAGEAPPRRQHSPQITLRVRESTG